VTLTRATTGRYQVRLMVTATTTSKAVTSKTYAYSVRAVPTLEKSGSQSLTAVIAGVAGQTVRLQQYDGRTWRTRVTYPATAKCVVTGVQPGYGYRIVVSATASIAGATSNTVQV
jgi:hypothetical protein